MKPDIQVHYQVFSAIPEETHNSMLSQISSFMNGMNNSIDYYIANRGIDSKSKIIYDNIVGKYAELCTSRVMYHSFGYPLMAPDFTVLDPSKKSWESDLPYSANFGSQFKNIHVKTCTKYTVNIVGQMSWTFQFKNKYDNGGQDALFKGNCSEDIVAMCKVDLDSREFILYATSAWKNLLPILRDPIKSDLKGLKYCIYQNDLIAQ